jgi:hypothetical protein
MIQNHSPANLNRDDLGAPKTCYFGGVLRSRISSQCLKRSIRMSDEFKALRGGVRTRQLAKLIARGTKGDPFDEKVQADPKVMERAEKILSDVVSSQEDADKSSASLFHADAIRDGTLLRIAAGKKRWRYGKGFLQANLRTVLVPDWAIREYVGTF